MNLHHYLHAETEALRTEVISLLPPDHAEMEFEPKQFVLMIFQRKGYDDQMRDDVHNTITAAQTQCRKLEEAGF